MKKRLGGVVRCAAALTLVGCAFVLSAQEGLRDRDPTFAASKQIATELNQSSAHWGPFYLLSHIQISDLGYSQEMYLPLAATSRGLSFAASAPQRLYFVPQRKTVYSIEVIPSYAFIRGNQTGSRGGNQFGWTARGDAQYLFNHLYLDLYGEGANDLRVSSPEINRVVTERNRELGGKGEIKYSSRTSFLFAAAHRTSSYPLDRFQPDDVSALLPLLDRNQNDYRVSLLHKTFPLTSLLLAAERSDYTFPNFHSRDARRTYTGAGFVWNHGREAWHLEAGPAKVDFKSPGAKNFTGLVGNTDGTFQVSERTVFNAAASRDIEFSVFAQNDYFLFDRAQASFGYSATRHLTLRVISEVGRDSYQVPVNGFLRRDQFSFTGVGWDYSVQHVQGGFDVGYYKRTSNSSEGEEQSGIRLLAHLSFRP
ncbi:MAG TPA: hypothetical protein VGJ88_01690 [Thermoanaerobaculia bacterium]|jgi:hypothetical protein